MAGILAKGNASRSLPVLAVTAVAAISAALAVVNLFTARGNTNLIAEVRKRQQVINQGIQLSPLNVQLSQLIGNLAYQSGDVDLRAVLERHGVSLGAGATPSNTDAPSSAGSPR
jgi:hypothetical protein